MLSCVRNKAHLIHSSAQCTQPAHNSCQNPQKMKPAHLSSALMNYIMCQLARPQNAREHPTNNLDHMERDQFRMLFVFSGSHRVPGAQWTLNCSLKKKKKEPPLPHGGPDRTWVRDILVDLSSGSGTREVGYRASYTKSLVSLWKLSIWTDPGTRKTAVRATTTACPEQ